MGRGFQAFIVAVVFVAIAAAVSAQVRVDVRLVNVVATVTDAKGRSVPNLTAADFVLEEDGKPQDIAHFSQDYDVPVSMGILLDTSGSMDGKIRTAVEAVERFTRRIKPNDDIFLITFSGSPTLRQGFTDDREKLSQALRRVTPTGGTALYDALSDGLVRIRSGKHTKRAILIITDGQDTTSTATLDDVLQSTRASDVLLYPVGISALNYAQGPDVPALDAIAALLPKTSPAAQSKRDEVDLNVLRAFAENSGGRAFLLAERLIDRGNRIEKVLDAIADELRSQYTLGFYPSRPDDGRFHSLRIRARAGITIRARRGYLATGS